MQGWLLLAMAIATSTVAQETELEESVAWSFPDAVHAIEARVGWVEAHRAETHHLPFPTN